MNILYLRILLSFFVGLVLYCETFAQNSSFFISTVGDNSLSVDTAKGGGYFSNNIVYYNGTGSNFIITKVDIHGSVKWTYVNNQFNNPDSSNHLVQIKATFDGGVIGIGSIKKNFISNKIDGLITYLDSSGNLKWQREYDFGNIESLNAIYCNSDSTFLITGIAGNDIINLKINNNGDSLWSKRIVLTPSDPMTVYGIEKLGSNYYFLGNKYDATTANFYYQEIYQIDSLGNLVWMNDYIDSSSVYQAQNFRITQDSFLLSLNTMRSSQNTYYQQVNKYDFQGNLIASFFPSIYGMLANDSTICGIYPKASTIDTGYIGLYNFYTNQFNSYSLFIPSGINYFLNACLFYNNAIVICGKIDAGGFGFNAFLAQYEDTLSIGTTEISNDNVFYSYPNPASNIINFKIGNDLIKQLKEYSISIYNTSGVMYFNQSFDNNSNIQLNISSLPSGLYYYKLTGNQKISIGGKILKH